MLAHTFFHVPGIGPKTERHLWSSGFPSWDTVDGGESPPLSQSKAEVLRRHIRESIHHLGRGVPDYFYERLPSDQQWRLFSDFRDSVAYLDIETTGLGSADDHITTIVVYDGASIFHYVHGDNLSAFRDDIEKYRLVVTYNGKSFDAPFIRNTLGAPMGQAHIDLRYVLAALGYRGGLKGCERQLGIDRGGLEDVDGFFAVLLWQDFLGGNRRALETLLAYNALDVLNLEALMVLAYNLKIQETPFAESLRLPVSRPPENPFTADAETIGRIKRRYFW